MELKEGTTVYTNDAKKAGRLQQVVVDPKNNDVTHIVIEKGFLFTDAKVVPIEYVVSATDERIDLKCTAQDVDEMSPLEIESEYFHQEGSGQPPQYIPVFGGVYPNSVILPTMPLEVRRTISSELVTLDDDANVISADDRNLGTVESYFTVAGEEVIDHFIVADGILNKTRKSVKVDWVKAINDEDIQLNISEEQYKALPDLKE